MSDDQKLFNFVLWLFAGCLLLVLLTSCSPLASYPAATQTPNATAQPTRSKTALPILSNKPITCTVKTGIETGALNLRKGRGTQYGVIRVLAESEVLTVINPGPWFEVVDSQGNHGFINSHYCEIGE